VDSEFKTVLLRVVVVGLVLIGVSAGLLLVAFRAFGSEKPRDFRPVAWIAALLAFILLGCLILMRFSFVPH
jgi:hypothetical protein